MYSCSSGLGQCPDPPARGGYSPQQASKQDAPAFCKKWTRLDLEAAVMPNDVHTQMCDP